MAKPEIVFCALAAHLGYVTGSPGFIPVCLYLHGLSDTLLALGLIGSAITTDRPVAVNFISLGLPLIT